MDDPTAADVALHFSPGNCDRISITTPKSLSASLIQANRVHTTQNLIWRLETPNRLKRIEYHSDKIDLHVVPIADLGFRNNLRALDSETLEKKSGRLRSRKIHILDHKIAISRLETESSNIEIFAISKRDFELLLSSRPKITCAGRLFQLSSRAGRTARKVSKRDLSVDKFISRSIVVQNFHER